jgi:hypothetical protein
VAAQKAHTVAGGWATIAGHPVAYPVGYVCHSSTSTMGKRDSIVSIATTTDVHRYPHRTRLSTSFADSVFSADEPFSYGNMTPRSSAIHSSGCSIGSCHGNQLSKEDLSQSSEHIAMSNNVAGFAASSSSGLPNGSGSRQHEISASSQESGEQQHSPQRAPPRATFMVSRVPQPPNPLLSGSVPLAATGVGTRLANAPQQHQRQQQRQLLATASRTTSFEGVQPSQGCLTTMQIQRAASFSYAPSVGGGQTPGVVPGLPSPAALQFHPVPNRRIL